MSGFGQCSQWLEHLPEHGRVTGLIPHQGHVQFESLPLIPGPDPWSWLGYMWEAANQTKAIMSDSEMAIPIYKRKQGKQCRDREGLQQLYFRSGSKGRPFGGGEYIKEN